MGRIDGRWGVGDGAFSSMSAGSICDNVGVRPGVIDKVGGEKQSETFKDGGVSARSSAGGGEGEEISIDNTGD